MPWNRPVSRQGFDEVNLRGGGYDIKILMLRTGWRMNPIRNNLKNEAMIKIPFTAA